MQPFEFNHGPYQFSCTLVHARRNSIMLRVMPDLSLLIKAPASTGKKWLNQLILKKAPWIVAQQRIIQNKQTLSNNHLSPGSRCYYLGEAYILDAREAEHESIQFESSSLILHCRDLTQTSDILKTWYKARALELFTERLQTCYDTIQHLALPFPEALRIKSYKSRWGSCGANKKISLNLELIQYPLACIDYVIFHELCHLRELNHGSGFYALMDQSMTDWQMQRHRLRTLHRTMPSIG
ncbi:MAG: SprT family zinc-dependent metalloprotease [Gammaproteobacteria bacterium]|nr:SprT family zinc-dependent metalloprotease [Gammaproteobacteria bacterium]